MNTETKFGIIAAILCAIGVGFGIGYLTGTSDACRSEGYEVFYAGECR